MKYIQSPHLYLLKSFLVSNMGRLKIFIYISFFQQSLNIFNRPILLTKKDFNKYK